MKHQKFASLIILAGAVTVDGLLLNYFPKEFWLSLWPLPLIGILLGVVVVVFCLRRSIWGFRFVGGIMILVGQYYLLLSFDAARTLYAAAIFHLIGFSGMFLAITLNYVNQIRPKNNRELLPLPDELPYVAAVIPTYGEPYEILEKTLISLMRLDYPADRLNIIISDDGHREEIRQMAAIHGVHYNKGAQKDAKAGNLNSALRYIEEHFPQTQLLLTEDSDDLIDPSFLRKIVPYFVDPKVACVQTPKDVMTPPGDPFGTRDRVFYDSIQAGRNGSGAAFACGSGVLWRIDSLKAIGGFATWNVVEDLTTTYNLHSAGYKSDYHNEILSIGLAPEDIPVLLKQRGTWAVDSWRLFLFDNPLLKPGLTFGQRLQYLEIGVSYVGSAFFSVFLLLTPLVGALTGKFVPIHPAALLAWFVVVTTYFLHMAKFNVLYLIRMRQFWDGMSPLHLKAFWIALRSRTKKPNYVVTRKTREAGFYGGLVWHQVIYMLVGSGLVINLLVRTDADFSTRICNALVVIYYVCLFSGICKASFYGLTLRFPKLLTLPSLTHALQGWSESSLNIQDIDDTRLQNILEAITTMSAHQKSKLIELLQTFDGELLPTFSRSNDVS